MKLCSLLLFAILTLNQGFSQSISKQLISSTSFNYQSTNYSLSSSLGELSITTRQNGIKLTDGFQQPLIITNLKGLFWSGDTILCYEDQIKVWTTGYVNIKWELPELAQEYNTSTLELNELQTESENIILWANGIKRDSLKIRKGTVEECPLELTIYQLITPNGDGDNDVFYVKNIIYVSSNEVLIWDQFGNIVFEKQNYDNQWTAKELPDGVYLYKVSDFDRNITYKGKLVIKRG
jgi:gliding motility-associated-like protein